VGEDWERGGQVLSWSLRSLTSSSLSESRIEAKASREACWGACAALSWTVSSVAMVMVAVLFAGSSRSGSRILVVSGYMRFLKRERHVICSFCCCDTAEL
jgi:hypothetical protein